MTRIPSHSIEDAPQAARSLLAEMVQFSPTGRLLNLHAQMAHAPAVLEAYVSIRRATARHGTLEGPIRSALMLAAAVHHGSEYGLAIISMLALRSGWRRDQVEVLVAGKDLGEEKTDALIGVVREAAANSGHVSDLAWAPGCRQRLERRAACRGIRLPGPDRLHLLLPQLRGDRADIPADAPGSGPADAAHQQPPVV
jgi:alkylhydroperoxidase family enzyme